MSSAYTYVYLLGSLAIVPLWAVWYWRTPAARREMLIMSAIFICIGVPSEALLYTRDWWHPATVTGTLVGLEDVLYSIGNGGYMAAIYVVVTRSHVAYDRQPPAWPLRLAPIIAIASLPLVLCLGFGLHSFVATSIGSLVALAIVLASRPDLARVAALSGIAGTALAIPVYLGMEALFPGWIAATWDLPHLGHLPAGYPGRRPGLVRVHRGPVGHVLQIRQRRTGPGGQPQSCPGDRLNATRPLARCAYITAIVS